METILFGSVKGAFTGALDKPGLLEEAHDGTLFLDELDSLSTLMQSKLLRVLQEKEACRIGDNKNYPVNCRIISSTNRDLNQLLKNGSIRQDLYFRLAVVTLEIPPLADRMEDIPVLVDYFISIYNDEFELNIQEVDDDVMEVFASYHWPGNVRELEHAIEYMMNFADSSSSRLSVRELPMKLKNIDIKQQSREKIDNSYNENLHEAISEFEKNFILNILNKENWNVTRAAKKMGIHREALYYRIKKHNLHEKQALES